MGWVQVQCGATVSSGKQCEREASSTGGLCAYHQTVHARRRARAFYVDRFSPDDQDALAVSAHLEGVDAEIAVLRVLIRRVAGTGDIDAARRGINTLLGLLKARHELDQPARARLATSLERVLDAMESEAVP